MLATLSFIGQRSSGILFLGLFAAAALPWVSAAMRPALPVLVALVLGLAIARLDLRAIWSGFADRTRRVAIFATVVLFMPLTCVVVVAIWRQFQLPADMVLLLVVFTAAPPLSSAASLSLMLGFDARVTLQVTLMAMLLSPFLGPLCFALVGLEIDIPILAMTLRIAGMILGGFAIGLSLQALLGTDRIRGNPHAFDGGVTIAMILFLFPVFDGVIDHVRAAPWQSFAILVLAVVLNIGGNIGVALAGARFAPQQTASAAGLMFGNRNVSIYLAVLPFNPMLSVFVAAAQIPIYVTPILWSRLSREQD